MYKKLFRTLKLQHPHTSPFAIHYYILNEEGSYGIELVKEPSLQGGEVSSSIAQNITHSYGEALAFAKLLVMGEVTPISLMDVVTDYMYERVS